MCDTVVAVGNSTKDGSVILGKNSNRVANEAHNIEYIPRKKHSRNSKVKCTYISIPQVEQTYDVLLLKPFWMFGCEMGANEHCLTIGNEAVWTKEPIRNTGLLGMDLMRLALERTKTAKTALEAIVSLLGEYGQGGQCSYGVVGRDYHNSFIIADPQEAWVLETADKYWIAEKVKNIRTISNTLSIETEYDLIHPDLIKHAVEKGYSKSKADFNFARDFIPKFRIYHAVKESSPRSQYFTKGFDRQQCTTSLMLRNVGKITPKDVMNVLRNHNIKPGKESSWSPAKAKANSPCHHATGMIIPDQSTGSLVSHILKDIQIHWVTGSSAPCISTFKPIFFPKPGLKKKLKMSGALYDPDSFWWFNEKFQRLVSQDYQQRLNVLEDERNELEKEFIKKTGDIIKTISGKPSEDELNRMAKISNDAFTESIKKIKEWTEKMKKLPVKAKPSYHYRVYWNRQNKQVMLKM